MQRVKLACALVLMFAIADTAQGQGIGGQIKKKAAEAVKPKVEEEPKDAGREPRIFHFEPTAEAMASYKRGLEIEIRVLNEYRNRLAKLKTRKQYTACEDEIATGPDALKLAAGVSARMEKATTPEDLQKVYAWQNEQFKAIALKQCGEDPRPLLQQRQEVLKNAEEAGATEAARGWKRKPSREEHDSAREEPEFTGPEDGDLEGNGEPSDVSLASAHSPAAPESLPVTQQGTPNSPQQRLDRLTADDLSDYRVAKEFIVRYCELSPQMRQDAEQRGISVPGAGKDVYWVFPRWFAVWVGPDCDHLIKLYTLLAEAAPPPSK